MDDIESYALAVLLIGAVGLVAVLANRLTERLKVPTPALLLVFAAIAVKIIPDLHAPSDKTVERLVTVALVCILFDGGMHIGWPRFRSAATPIAVVGVLGTFLTVGGAALLAHYAFDVSWYAALLLATAVSPTDPAVVFSVLGQREVSGRAGTILEGESGANDPVGIALMVSLISAGALTGGAVLHVAGEFLLQMGVGAAFGVIGAKGLLLFMRRVPLPSEGLYPIRTLASILALFGVTTLAHGSGFLAVFVAGILLGDREAPYKREVERFHAALASLGEIVAFVVLGLVVDLSVLSRANVWVPGLALGAVLAFVIRPALVGLSLLPTRLARNERAFILLAGLKGAVPILLGVYLLTADVAVPQRLFGIVIVVVVFSVVVQGSLVPTLAKALRLPMRTTSVSPYSLGVRLREEPEGVHRMVVVRSSLADGCSVGELPGHIWVSSVVRKGGLVAVRPETQLRAGDEVIVFADPDSREELSRTFETERAA